MVHCHAGYGRTGVVIACYLIYNSFKTVNEIVLSIRQKRGDCIQKKEQYSYCEKFAEFINKSRLLFDLSGNNSKKSIEYFINNQNDILFGIESEKYKHIPKLIYKILERLIFVKNKFNVDLLSFCNYLCAIEEWNSEHEQVLIIMKVRFILTLENVEQR